MSAHEVKTEVTGSVWKILVAVGDQINEGEEVVTMESMKMEIPVLATADGTVKDIIVQEGDSRNEGETVLILER